MPGQALYPGRVTNPPHRLYAPLTTGTFTRHAPQHQGGIVSQQYPQQQPQWGAPQQPQWTPPPPKKKTSGAKILGFGCAGIIGLIVIIGVIAALASGGSKDSVKSKPASAASSNKKTPSSTSAPKKAEAAKVGDTITIHGSDDGSKLNVTVVKVADPGKPADEFTQAAAGKRFVGVQFKLVNAGSTVYGDSPSNGAQVADKQGQQFEATFADITAGPAMSSDVKLKPGGTALGWIVFEVPKASAVDTVHFTMDSGFADQTAEWKLK